MGTNAHSSAGVYVRELDLSQRVAAASTSIGAIVGASDKGPVMERTLITSVRQFIETFGKPNPRTSYMHYCALAFLEESSRLYVTRVLSNANDALTAGAFLTVDDLAAETPLLSLNNFDNGTNTPLGRFDPFNTTEFDPTTPGIENTLFMVCAINPGTWNNDLHVRIRPSNKRGVDTPDDPYVFWIEVFVDYKSNRQAPVEAFLVSRDYKIDGFGNQMFIEEVINNKSKYIRVRNNPYAPAVKVLRIASEFLDGGTNGGRPSDAQINQGWELYRDPEQLDVNILINGGYATPAVQLKMDDICQDRMDCIAVLDMPSGEQEVSRAVNYRRNTLNLDSSRSAIYSSDVKILDTYNDREIFIPPSGHAAAAYARTDEEAETWFAPAGMNRGRLDILEARVIYNQGDRDALTDAQINSIRLIPGAGYRIWGADTLQSMASALSNVNVRRLLNFIEKSVSIAALYSVFNPNDFVLRAQLTEMTNRFLNPIKTSRGLYHFQVVCDESNNPPELVGSGDTILDVYLDPVIPAKRIHLNAIVTKTGANFKEVAQARSGEQ
jgi:phage tail sheath protein FI